VVEKDMINDDVSCSLEFDLELMLGLEFIGMHALGGASTSLVCVYIGVRTDFLFLMEENQARLK
jgi:hypothetical protein